MAAPGPRRGGVDCPRCQGGGRRGLFGHAGFGLLKRRCLDCGGSGKAQGTGPPPRPGAQQPQEDTAWQEFFLPIRPLGSGAFGQVYQVRAAKELENANVQMEVDYALKLLNKKRYMDPRLLKYVKAERNVLRSFDHPFLVSLVHAFSTPAHWVLVMDFASGGSLGAKLGDQPAHQPGLEEGLARRYSSEIATAIEFLHSNNIIYRDLKPDNVVLNGFDHAQLTDFGLAKEHHDDAVGAVSRVGSVGYAAPEVLGRKEGDTAYTTSVDWYSLGVTMYVLLTGGKRNPNGKIKNTPPRNHDALVAALENDSVMSEQGRAVVKQLTSQNAADRGDATAIKAHPFFAEIRWATMVEEARAAAVAATA